MDVRKRFLRGLADAAGLERDLLDRPGTSIRANEQRRDTSILVWYQAGEQALIWCDPELIDRFADLADEERFTDQETVTERAQSSGLVCMATANMRVLAVPTDTASQPGVGSQPGGVPMPIASGYRQHWLRSDEPAHYDLVKAFADRSDPDDVEEAALDELDGVDTFEEVAINVLTADEPAPDADADRLVAYASAVKWDWDHDFADIGVLVDPAHRGRGLGSQVVSHTVARLLADGRLPLYRHGLHNKGSQRIAELNGFEIATTLAFFTPPED